VFTFRCAGCGKQHVVDEPFTQDYATRCLRCGETIHITTEIVHPIGAGVPSPGRSGRWDEAITASLPEGATAGSGTEVAERTEDVPADEAEGPDDEDGETSAGPGASRSRARRPGQRPGRGGSGTDQAEEDGEADDPIADEAERKPRSRAEDDRLRRRRWLLIGGGVAVVLALAGGGAYLFLGRGNPSRTPDRASRSPSTKKDTARVSPATEKGPEKPVKPREADVRIAATRLSTELAANAAAANQKYRERLLEVSGLVERLENKVPGQPANKPATPPTHNHLRFACEGPPVVCNLDDGPTQLTSWRSLQLRQPITVRGVYGTDGILHHCELLPLTAPADGRFKGTEVELAGFVKAVVLPTEGRFPSLVLEGDTDSFTDVQCLFRIADREELRKLPPGLGVIVRGMCSGRVDQRELGSGRRVIRIDNCQLTDTTAPRPGVARLSAIELVRAYEEDLRPVFVPAPGAELQVAEPLSVAQMNKAWSADPHALVQRCQNKVITVSGKLLKVDREAFTLVLISDNTDEPLQVQGLFDRASFEDLSTDLKTGTECCVRGRCTGPLDALVWRLQSCQAAEPALLRSPYRLTADFLPHRPGQQLTYDLAEYPVAGKREGPVKRLLLLQQEGGKTETVVTHAGVLAGKGLFDGDDSGQWVSHKKTLAARLPGPAYFQRISAGFVEVGQVALKKDGTREIVWRPVLKLGTRAGDVWKWPQGNLTHDYVVDKFDDWRGRPRVVVTETVTSVADPAHPLERRHVYVRDVGEVEQRDWLRITSKERVLVGEKKLLEEEASPSRPELKGKPGPVPELLGRPTESPPG